MRSRINYAKELNGKYLGEDVCEIVKSSREKYSFIAENENPFLVTINVLHA